MNKIDKIPVHVGLMFGAEGEKEREQTFINKAISDSDVTQH